MTWQNTLFRGFTRVVQLMQGFVPDDSPRVWDSIRWLSQYVKYPAVFPPVDVEKETRAGIDCEWLTPETVSGDGIIFALHGGANVFAWHSMHRHTYGWMAHYTQRRLLAPDFRVGGSHPYPAGLDDCLAVYKSLLDDDVPPESICLVGDSSGGNIAAALLLRLREEGLPMPGAVEFIAPVLDVTFQDDNPPKVHDPFTNLAFIRAQFQHYCQNIDAADPMCSPVFADLAGLPPMRIDVGEDEILRNDAAWFARNADSAGVSVKLVIWPEMWHGWYLYAPYLPDAIDVHQAIGEFIRDHI